MFDDLVKIVNDVKRPALEFHHEDILGRIDTLEENQRVILQKLENIHDCILDKKDATFKNVTTVLGDK